MYEMLREFARWLIRKRGYDEEAIKTLLYEEWDSSRLQELLDVIANIENFLRDMASFAVEKAFGDMDEDPRFQVLIVAYGSFWGSSCIYVLEMKTRTVLASLEEDTQCFGPDVIEEGLEGLIGQLEEAKSLLAVRLIADS